MKKLFLIYSLFISSALLQAQTGFQIKGKVKGWHDTVCYFGNYYGKYNSVKDTSRIDKEGNFVFSGKETQPGGVYLIIFPNKTSIEFLLNKDPQFFSFEADTGKMIETMKIKGSEDNEMYYKYLRYIVGKYKESEPFRKRIAKINEDSLSRVSKKDSIKILQDKLSVIDKDVEKYKEDLITKHADKFLSALVKGQKDPTVPDNPDKKDSLFSYRYYKDHYWDNMDPSDDRLLRTPMFHPRLKNFFDKVVVQDPDSIIKEADKLVEMTKGNKETFKYVVWYMTTTYENHTIMGMDAVFVHEVNKYYRTHMAYWVDTVTLVRNIHRADIIEPLLLKKPAPTLVMQDTLDRNISLYEVKAKYTIVVFWNPDCGHCQKVIPKLRDEYEKKLKAKGVQVYSVDIEDNTEKWKKFIIDNKLTWINVHDKYNQYPLRDRYDIYSTPVIYLLDENKKIRGKRIDVEQLDGYIDFLNKLKEKGKLN